MKKPHIKKTRNSVIDTRDHLKKISKDDEAIQDVIMRLEDIRKIRKPEGDTSKREEKLRLPYGSEPRYYEEIWN